MVFQVACTGGGADDESNTNEGTASVSDQGGVLGQIKPDIETSHDIVANPEFSFTIDTLIVLEVSVLGDTPGAVHVYTKRENIENLLVPDPLSRIDSFNPDYSAEVELLVTSGVSELILHWVPMTAEGQEQIIALSLAPDQYQYEVVF